MRIRVLKELDIPQVANAHVSAWKRGFRGILSDAYLDNLTVEQFEAVWHVVQNQQDRTNLVADVDDQVIGFVAFGPTRGGDVDADNVGEIYGLYVHPDHWRMGAGGQLITEALKQIKAQAYTEVILWTMTDNQISRGFYEKKGFCLDGATRISERSGETFEEVRFKISL